MVESHCTGMGSVSVRGPNGNYLLFPLVPVSFTSSVTPLKELFLDDRNNFTSPIDVFNDMLLGC